MNHFEQLRVRIVKKGIYHSDIRYPGLLTDDEIAYIPIERVYEWVRQGMWKPRDFNKWLRVLRVIE